MNTEERIKELVESLKHRVEWNEAGRLYVKEKVGELALDFLKEKRIEVFIEQGIIQLYNEPIFALQILSLALPEMKDRTFSVIRGIEKIGIVSYSGEQIELGPIPGDIFIGQGVKFIQGDTEQAGSIEVSYSYISEIGESYKETLEELGWSVSSYTDDGRVEINKYSPAGEDFSICVDVNDFPQSVAKCAEDFDVDEHVEMWIEGRKSGVSGIPSSIRELLEDAEAIGKMIQELADALKEA